MKKVFIILILLFLSVSGVYAFAIKVYDEYGNRVGTYRKDGDRYQLYDFNDNKVENPESLIQNPPSQKSLSEYTMLYNENMMPIGTLRPGLYHSNEVYFPPELYYYPAGFRRTSTPHIVRPSSKQNFPPHKLYRNYTNIITPDTPRFRKF